MDPKPNISYGYLTGALNIMYIKNYWHTFRTDMDTPYDLCHKHIPTFLYALFKFVYEFI